MTFSDFFYSKMTPEYVIVSTRSMHFYIIRFISVLKHMVMTRNEDP